MNYTKLMSAVVLSAILAACSSVQTPQEALETQSTRVRRLSGWVTVANGACEKTFTTTGNKTIDHIDIKIGGAIPANDLDYWDDRDPGVWHMNSLTLPPMPDTITGSYHEDFSGGVPVKGFHESNTDYHDGQAIADTWTMEFNNPSSFPCADYDNQVKVIFTLIP
jgi:hypothetical protein